MHKDFPIIAIGASAGGLEAVSELLAALPGTCDMAFVVIQHLDPDHKSLLSELLGKKTRMPVNQIHDGVMVEPAHVYVIPPKTSLTIADDRFRLTPRLAGQHHPIDTFFSSLAETRTHAAIGVVLSGGDSDGSAGVQAIKRGGGITFAQKPESARFPNMPRNAIDTDCVDFVLAPEEIAQELIRLGSHPYLRAVPSDEDRVPAESPPVADEGSLKRVFRRLRSAHGVDFTEYKRSTLQRRLARRMALRQIAELPDYLAVLEDDAAEAAALYQDFLIRVTSFFRDPEAFNGLRERVFPSACEGRSPKDPIRIWIPGCATGEEVYSIAMALVEYLGERSVAAGIQIFGTDVSEMAIDKARDGLYLENISQDVSPERLARFFNQEDNHYRISKQIRDLCIFARQDVTQDPPFSRLDLVSCRNLLIYLDPRAQRRVMQAFHYSLRPRGYMMLGPSESVGTATDLFELIDKFHRLYTRNPAAAIAGYNFAHRTSPGPLSQSEETVGEQPFAKIPSLQEEADRWLLARFAPASILIDDDLNIIQFRGETGPYLEPASGPSSLNLQRVVRPQLMVEIAPAIAEARSSGAAARREGLSVDGLGQVDLEVVPLNASTDERGYLIFLEDASRPRTGRRGQTAEISALSESDKDRRLAQIEREMEATRDYLRAKTEEHDAIREELKSAHEEVLSANEEFQSTNEELETAKEELQSSNEELTTTNEELRSRNRELGVLNAEVEKARLVSDRARTYADAIVSTVREALLVLDADLRVIRANQAFYLHFDTSQTRAEGQLLSELQPGPWSEPGLLNQLRSVVEDNSDMTGFEIHHVTATGARRMLLLNARRIPADDARAALILLAIKDNTGEQAHADALKISDARFRAAVAAVHGIVWTNNAVGQMEGAQPEWAALTGQTVDEYQGYGWSKAVHPEDVQPTIDAWQETLARRLPFFFEHRVRRRDGEWRHFAIRAIPVFNEAGALQQWVGVHMDVTDLRKLERERTHLLEAEQSARTEAESANRVKDEFLATLSHELRTPITIIVGWSRLLLKKHGGENEDLTKGLNLIINNAMMQAQIISDLLDMSSIVSGKTILNLKPLDLRDCVVQSVAAQQLAAKEKGVDLTMDPDGEPQVVLADAGRLQQVLGNLLTNALKFTPGGGGRISVRSRPVDDNFEVSIEDTGEGIAPEFLPHIFGRFKQAEEFQDRKHGGLGLGLAIVKQLIEMLGGSVRAESEGRGHGARFTVSLPRRKVGVPQTTTSSALDSPEQAFDSLKGAHALVVEDNAAMLEFVGRVLEERGALVIGVRTAKAALEALSAPDGMTFNVLVSDIGLAGMDGYELLRQIRGQLNISPERLPAVAVTAFGRKEDRQHALDAGFQAHLAKPYEVTQLISIISRLSGASGHS